ncbi:MAG: hypothetical protein GOU97_03810 [Nanoarchaeota archaeon]|nr:hypothetical protein [Nanoarchaeota archaeon]
MKTIMDDKIEDKIKTINENELERLLKEYCVTINDQGVASGKDLCGSCASNIDETCSAGKLYIKTSKVQCGAYGPAQTLYRG